MIYDVPASGYSVRRHQASLGRLHHATSQPSSQPAIKRMIQSLLDDDGWLHADEPITITRPSATPHKGREWAPPPPLPSTAVAGWGLTAGLAHVLTGGSEQNNLTPMLPIRGRLFVFVRVLDAPGPHTPLSREPQATTC